MPKNKVSTQAQKMRSLLIDYRGVFRSEEGKRVLRDMMLNNHVLSGTFDKDHATMAFREGQKSVIMDILEKLRVDLEQFAKMYDDQYSEES